MDMPSYSNGIRDSGRESDRRFRSLDRTRRLFADIPKHRVCGGRIVGRESEQRRLATQETVRYCRSCRHGSTSSRSDRQPPDVRALHCFLQRKQSCMLHNPCIGRCRCTYHSGLPSLVLPCYALPSVAGVFRQIVVLSTHDASMDCQPAGS